MKSGGPPFGSYRRLGAVGLVLLTVAARTAMSPGGVLHGQGGPLVFGGTLSGDQQVPPTASTGTGKGTVVLDAIEQHITVNLNFSGLSSNANAAHIHGP